MQTMTIAQAKNQLSSLIHAAEQGEEVILTRHGKPVVRLVAEHPINNSPSLAAREAAVLAHFEAARKQLSGKVKLADIRALRDEGRRF